MSRGMPAACVSLPLTASKFRHRELGRPTATTHDTCSVDSQLGSETQPVLAQNSV